MRRTRKIEVRVSDEEHERLLELAQAADMNVSAYVRALALRRPITEEEWQAALESRHSDGDGSEDGGRITTSDVRPDLEAATHASGTAVTGQRIAESQRLADDDGGPNGAERRCSHRASGFCPVCDR